MNLFRNRLILGLIFRTITGAINLVYKIICLFNLQLALLVILLGFIAFVICGVEPSGVVFTIFVIALFLSIIIAVFGTVRNLLGLNNKPKKKRGAQIVDAKPLPSVEQPQVQAQAEPVIYAQQSLVIDKPVYFRTKKNPNYVFAEYSDRYELFKIADGQLIKIRTDYK